MSSKTYAITLANGYVIENLGKNGSYYISKTEIDPAIFEGNCSPVTITDGEETDIYDNMSLIAIRKQNDECWFALREITEAELTSIQYAAMLRYITPTVTDEAAVNCVDLFPIWSGNSHSYSVGERVRYGKQLYKCVQAHTSQTSWTPTAAASLWARMDDPAVEYPEWVQPTGAHDAYTAGSKVSHNNSKWISDVDNNTWEPGVYGWTNQEG